ncbi:bifunctional oligoribonuclease/PAP phosphatase NrnA [Geotalea sp. SG265]|uniref:DHH family phosphoesterase n=1 Tax=Geotalea sp. SG265 TaxID=2922867 RepID=UPI001FAF886D|nr:bifunctional oligoribonuclease/PAP phosphatase NrnA [Geotalea sp. SG265]
MIKKIADEIAANTSFLITTHESPDGDAVGSSLALAGYLTGLGKDVTVYLCDPVPDIYQFLPLADKVVNGLPPRHYDVCFVLDVGELRRAGTAITSCRTIGKFVNIDHHLNCEQFGAINYVDTKACATGALIYRIIEGAGQQINYDIALCIYTAVITDTGSFRYSNANPEAFAIAAKMVEKGINAWDVAEKLYESQPQNRLQLLALALATLSFSPFGDYASIAVTLDMYRQCNASAELTDGFVNYPRSIKGVEVAVFFREIREGLFKVGFRSKGKVDVSALAAAFSGGGHHNAAGCTVEGTLSAVKEKIFTLLEQSLRR